MEKNKVNLHNKSTGQQQHTGDGNAGVLNFIHWEFFIFPGRGNVQREDVKLEANFDSTLKSVFARLNAACPSQKGPVYLVKSITFQFNS